MNRNKKRIIAIIMSLMMGLTLVPCGAFAAEETEASIVTGDTVQNQGIEETTTQAVEAVGAEAVDTETPKTDTVTTQSSGSMRIYALYLHRKTGDEVSSDRYGDAVLIESAGKYLLMDTGEKAPVKGSSTIYYSNIAAILKAIGVTELDVYISHLHGDHTGGLVNVCRNFKVNKVYLPDTELAKDYVTPNTGTKISSIYESNLKVIQSEKSVNPDAEIVYLSPSYRKHYKDAISSFTVGDAKVKIIGPAGNYTINQFASQDGIVGTKEGHYLNNYSLCARITCGGFSYLTTGDIEKQEEKNLMKKCGSTLNSDMMKVNHHGLRTSNQLSFIKKVSPKWSFEEDHGFSSAISASVANAMKYGFNYAVAKSKTSLFVDVNSGKVRLYKDSNHNYILDDKPIAGWVKVGSNYQYYSPNGYIASGWKKISGKKYYFSSSSGFRFTGTHKINGKTYKFNSKGVLVK